MRLKLKRRNLPMSFSDAAQGIAQAVQTERNMRIHLLLGLLVLVCAGLLGVTRLELALLVLAIGLVLAAELFNTALEELVDFSTPDFHPLAGRIKNIAAGAVLVAAFAAAAVGYLVFIDYFLQLDELAVAELPLKYLLVPVLALVVLVILGWRGLIEGSRPSGYTAAAFALAVIISETGQGLPVVAGFLLALLVGRVEGKRHSWWEIVSGALLGICVAWVCVRLLA